MNFLLLLLEKYQKKLKELINVGIPQEMGD